MKTMLSVVNSCCQRSLQLCVSVYGFHDYFELKMRMWSTAVSTDDLPYISSNLHFESRDLLTLPGSDTS